ncbi:hypothetical protein [Ralstonia thomasii]|uniref:hypothetical protein n=1 Tax=Ralstonia thomasii TaxID=3058596 RepID=UPI00292E6DC6|nr:hypothetical protein [Ralstonia sp. LMG 18095]
MLFTNLHCCSLGFKTNLAAAELAVLVAVDVYPAAMRRCVLGLLPVQWTPT